MWNIFKLVLTYCLSVYSVKCQNCDQDKCNSKIVHLKPLFSNQDLLEKYQNSHRDRIIYIETSGWWFDICNLDWSSFVCFEINLFFILMYIHIGVLRHLFKSQERVSNSVRIS